jgi:predicted Zn finger-like uncharacterized protein
MIVSRMLVTTCPGCDTTFKVTVAILEKAGGQVRCGRCARIFDANSKLREQPEATTERLPSAPDDLPEMTTDGTGEFSSASATGSRWFLRDDPPPAQADPAAETGSNLAALAAAMEALAVPDAIGYPGPVQSQEPPPVEAVTGSEPDNGADPGSDEPARPDQPYRVDLDPDPDPGTATDWRDDNAAMPRRRTWPWAVGAGLLTLSLAGQLIHAARSDVAALPGVGPLLISAYAKLGREIAPPVAIEQYSTLDLTAVAEPVSDEHGWLIIETRVQNRGPKVQPFPHILVRLLDRWQETIAGRYFSPDEYLVTPQSDYSRMNVGTTADAQFIIVDPGPSATGFELEFCTPVEDGFRCETE